MGAHLEDLEETLRPTGDELDEELDELKIDFEVEVFESDFGAGEFQTFIGKFLKCFFSSFSA